MLRRDWESARFGDALRLLKVSSLMHDYDPVGVHQAVSDDGGGRRCNYEPLEIKVRGGSHFFHHLALLHGKVVNNPTTYVALRGLKSFRRFDLSRLRRIERFDQELSEQSGQKWELLPHTRFLSTVQNVVDNRQVTAVCRDEMIEALAHAPTLGSGFPVELIRIETAKDILCVVGDRGRLADETV